MNPLDLVVRNARVATAADVFDCDIGIAGGRIVALAQGLPAAAREIDAAGRIVTPGGVDAHCHLDQPMPPPARMADDFDTGTRSAACGGTTTKIGKEGGAVDRAVGHVEEVVVRATRGAWEARQAGGHTDVGRRGRTAVDVRGAGVSTDETGERDLHAHRHQKLVNGDQRCAGRRRRVRGVLIGAGEGGGVQSDCSRRHGDHDREQACGKQRSESHGNDLLWWMWWMWSKSAPGPQPCLSLDRVGRRHTNEDTP